MLMPGSETYFLGVSAHVSLKVAIKGSFWDKRIRKLKTFKDFLSKNRGVRPKEVKYF